MRSGPKEQLSWGLTFAVMVLMAVVWLTLGRFSTWDLWGQVVFGGVLVVLLINSGLGMIGKEPLLHRTWRWLRPRSR